MLTETAKFRNENRNTQKYGETYLGVGLLRRIERQRPLQLGDDDVKKLNKTKRTTNVNVGDTYSWIKERWQL